MFIRFYELYYSREAMISRLRRALVRTLGREIVVYGRKFVQVFQYNAVVPNKDNLVINVRRDGKSMSITVTPWIEDPAHIQVMVPTALIKDQLRPVAGSQDKFEWRTSGGKTFRGVDGDGNGHIRFVVRAPLGQFQEDTLLRVVEGAYEMADEFEYGSDDDMMSSSEDDNSSGDDDWTGSSGDDLVVTGVEAGSPPDLVMTGFEAGSPPDLVVTGFEAAP